MITVQVTKIGDTLGDRLRQLEALPGKLDELAGAAGAFVANWAQQAFEDEDKRPLPWSPRRGGNSDRPLLKRSRALQRSIRSVSLGGGKAAVTSDRPYAAFHQHGTNPYTIKARNRRALFWPGAAHPVKEVRHPGLPRRPFIPIDDAGNLMPAAATELEEILTARLDALLKP